VAQAVAETLGFHYLNSGALYRVVALLAAETGTDLTDVPALVAIARKLSVEFAGDTVVVNGRDVNNAIRGEVVSAAASRIAANGDFREALLDYQRAFRRPPGLVADGRDMGSVVFPDAPLKIFLTASPEVRAARRHKQLMEKGMGATITALLEDIRARDERDSARAVAPLQKRADAVLLDTTRMSVEEAVAQVLALYKQAPKAP
jgi:cytidylate kinase